MHTAHLTWVRGLQFVSYEKSKHAIVIDTSEAGGGFGTGNGPMDLVLEALAGCSAMDVVSILLKKRQKLTGFQIEAEGVRAEEHPRVFTKIHLKYIVEGQGISEKAVRDAIELSKDKYCSVSAMLAKTAKITYDIDLRNRE